MNLVDAVEGERRPVLVVIAGPIAGGKSTVARALTQHLRTAGEQAALVELDQIAGMALPTLPDWGAAHAIFNSVVGQWLRTPLTVVVGEGPGSQAEVDALIREIPGPTTVTIVLMTSSFDIAFARASADPSRGVSRQHAFLSNEFARWKGELPRMQRDLLIDTGVSSVDESVSMILDSIRKTRARA